MTPTKEILLDAARQRATITPMPYAGAVSPQEAFMLLNNNADVKLIDVRTKAERDWVGRVAVDPLQHSAVEWNQYPSGTPNPAFLDQLAQVASQDQILLFLCRSGVRSRHAATLATANGYPLCFDILEGFEGDKDQAGHRKMVGGWCNAGLPWIGA